MRLLPLTIAIVALLVGLNPAHAKSRAYSAPPCWAGTSDIPACAAYMAYVHQTFLEQTPPATRLGYGDAGVDFKVSPSGRVTVIRYYGSTFAHIQMALWILKSIRLRPPPGPYALARQQFAFH
ncbi:hypothetical protein IYW40_02470 [Methylocystis sp. H4A]|uniref:hypothetical protein n=1 Tax=Methylocystis sp. H4A TaxID=2785788 RepID=UPI0018C1F608|nr:hypothetical protein [Methylocystis sp. H4A]MBG0800367.1 hypothetical protein [Methylocystis sp. H4A]